MLQQRKVINIPSAYHDQQTAHCNKMLKYLTRFAVGVVIITGLACLWA